MSTGIYVIGPALTIGLIALHTLKVEGVQVDPTTLGLLGLLMLMPLAPHIRRLSAGGVEAEIGPGDARRLQAAAADLPSGTAVGVEPLAEAPTIEELIARDPPLGLAKLRIDLEREVRRLYLRDGRNASRRGMSLGVMARELRNRQQLPPEIYAPLEDVNVLANRAVHGEYVAPEVAREIAQVGRRVLAALWILASEPPPDGLDPDGPVLPARA